MIDSDTWWHLRTGQWIVEHRALPAVDRFSFTRVGEEWHYPGWLAQIIMFAVYSFAGLAGLNAFFILIALLACLLIYLTQRGDSFISGFAIVIAAASAAIYWTARPQLFTFLFGALYYLIIWKYLKEGSRKLLWLLPLVMFFWVNMHGGFAVGFLLLIIAILGQSLFIFLSPDRRNRKESDKILVLIGIGLVCLVAALCNPYGLEMLNYPFKTVSIQVLQSSIQEWQSPDFHLLNAQPFLWLLFLTWLVLSFSPIRPDPRDCLFLLVISYMGFLAWRNVPLLSIFAPSILSTYANPILVKVFPRWVSSREGTLLSRRINIFILLIFLVTAASSIYLSTSEKAIQDSIRRQLPVAAAEYLARHPGMGPMLNSYNWGSYLLWRLPEEPVFVDGRTDVYDDELLSQYLTTVNAQNGWRNTLTQWNIGLVFLEPTAPLVQLLLLDGWRTEYQDAVAVILRAPAP